MNTGMQTDGSRVWMAFVPVGSTGALAELRLSMGETTEAAFQSSSSPSTISHPSSTPSQLSAFPSQPFTSPGWWLRGRGSAESALAPLRRVGDARVFLLEEGKLIAAGERLPRGPAPNGLAWRPLQEVFRPELPEISEQTATVFAGWPDPVPMRLERGGPERPAGFLLTTLEDFAAWVETAPEARLRPLDFAASPDGRVAVRGDPLPDLLAARRFSLDRGVAAPCGWTWTPEFPATVLAEALGVPPGAVALLHENGEREDIPAEAWVPVSRAAARATLGPLVESGGNHSL